MAEAGVETDFESDEEGRFCARRSAFESARRPPSATANAVARQTANVRRVERSFASRRGRRSRRKNFRICCCFNITVTLVSGDAGASTVERRRNAGGALQTNYRRVKIDAEKRTVARAERFSVESGPDGGRRSRREKRSDGRADSRRVDEKVDGGRFFRGRR